MKSIERQIKDSVEMSRKYIVLLKGCGKLDEYKRVDKSKVKVNLSGKVDNTWLRKRFQDG